MTEEELAFELSHHNQMSKELKQRLEKNGFSVWRVLRNETTCHTEWIHETFRTRIIAVETQPSNKKDDEMGGVSFFIEDYLFIADEGSTENLEIFLKMLNDGIALGDVMHLAAVKTINDSLPDMRKILEAGRRDINQAIDRCLGELTP